MPAATVCRQPLGTCLPRHRADVPGGARDGRAHGVGAAVAPRAPTCGVALRSVRTGRRAGARSAAGPASPPRRTRATIARGARLGRAIANARRRQQLRHGAAVGRSDDLASTRRSCSAGTRRCPGRRPASSAESDRAPSSPRGSVLIATQSGSLSDDTVGRCSAGSSAISLSRSPRLALSISPTRPCASIAALSSSARFSILVFFHAVRHAPAGWRSAACWTP